MNCNKCGNKIQQKDKFCPECGAKVLRVTAARVVPCPSTIDDGVRTRKPCGEEIKEGKKFCNECGWKINQSCFQPGAKMCSGEQNGAPCNNIVFPDTKFCSQCGKPPDYEAQNPVNSGDLNRNANNPNIVPPVIEKDIDLSLNVAATVREENQMLDSYVVVNTEGKQSSDSNGNSPDVKQVDKNLKTQTFSETEDNKNIKIKDEVKNEEKMQVDQAAESTGGQSFKELHSSNKELVKEEKEQSEVVDENTSLNDDHHTAKPCSKQPENLVHKNVPPPTESLTISHETSKPHKSDRAKLSSGNSTKDEEDEKSSDIWTPPNQTPKSGVLSTVENPADKKDHKTEHDSEERQKPNIAHTKDNETVEMDIEESDTDSDSSSEESQKDESNFEAGGQKPKKRQKKRKKAKEKYLKKLERKERNKTNKENSDTAVDDFNRPSKKKEQRKGNESSSTTQTHLENTTYPSTSKSSLFTSGSESEGQLSQAKQPEEGLQNGSSVDSKQYQKNNNESGVGQRSFASVVGDGPHKMTTRSKSDTVQIHFQAIGSHKFVGNPGNVVYITFALAEYGGLPSMWRTNILPIPGPDGHWVVTYTGDFSKQRIKTSGIRYRYCVAINNNPSNVLDEYVYDAYKVDENNLRNLQQKEIPDVWVQYDGMLNPLPEKSVLQTIKSVVGWDSYEKKIDKNTDYVARYFFPKWRYFFVNGWDTSGADMVRHVDMLFEGLMKNVFLRCKKWTLEKNFKEYLGKVWMEDLKPKLDDLERNPDLISAIGIIVLWEQYSLPLDENYKNALFRSLVMEGNDQEKKCPMYDMFKDSFQGIIPRVKNALQEFIKSFKGSWNPTWMCSLPLYHFLLGKCRPYEEMNKRLDHNAQKPVWWGKDGIEMEMDYLKGKTNWSIDPETILRTLAPMFEIDFYLPRAFMSVLRLEKLTVVKTKLLPPEVVMASLYFFSKTEYFETDLKKKIHLDCLEVVADQMRKSCNSENISQNEITRAFLCVKIGGELLSQTICSHREKTDMILRTIEVFIVALAVYEQLMKRRCKDDSNANENDHLLVLNERKKLIDDWLSKFIFYPSVEKDLKVWNRLLSIDVPDSSIKDTVMNGFKQILQNKLDKEQSLVKEHLISLYCNDADQLFKPAIQEILGNIVSEALERGHVCEERTLSGKGSAKYGSMLSRLFERSWEKTHLSASKSWDIFIFTLSWRPFVQFLDMFYQKEKSMVLSEECQLHFTQATSVIQLMLNNLLFGKIKIGEVLFIDKSKEVFYDLNNIIWKCDKAAVLDKELVFQTLKLRCKEIKTFKDVCADIGELVHLCQHFHVDLDKIDQKLQAFTKMDTLEISEVCKPGIVEKVSDVNAYEPVLTAFELPPDIVGVVQKLKKLSEGMLFLNIWIKQGQKEAGKKNGPLTVNEVIENVWQNAHQSWVSLGRKITSGDITFKEFQQHFKNIPNDNLEQQLMYISMPNNKDWIKERLRQFNQYRILEQCVYGANVILKVAQEYELKGDFQPIKMIEKMVQGTDTKMNEFDSSLIDACDVLRGIKDEHARCLEEFINCKKLIDWLRKSMESLKELKVFVDLASISAGEGDMEVAKVKCLHAATTGYAPLIFNLGDKCDYSKFLEQCKLVWKELKADPDLPIKLKATNQHLEWLNSVKSAQGSVEVTSMRQAEAINSVGIYMVGKIDANVDKEKPTIDDVLQLHVQKDEKGSRLPRRYQYKELQELQSKLMLVAGKAEMGKDDVDRFTIVYDAIVRLCNVYIKLVSSGCVLFSNWQARFLCDPDRKVCAFVKFGSGDGCTQLKGGRNEGDDVSTIIPRLAKFMEVCLEEWLKYIDHKRDEYQHLNFFTIDQMVILQKELVLMGGEVEPSDLIYPLLSIVKHDCTKMDLIGALKKAKGDVSQKEAEQEVELEDNEEVKEDVDPDKEENIKATAIAKFIAEMMSSGYTEILAREALKKGLDPENIDEGIVWCMEHEDLSVLDMETEVSEDQVEVKVEEFEGWTKPGMSISTITQNILSGLQTAEEDTLIPDLEHLWEEFLSSISSSVSDYLSVEHLGIILRRLAETETFTVDRPLIPGFERGAPNLLLCPQDEILNTVLTIYSHNPDQPLPQSDEILMCTPHTTLDEVEIFWRRAVFDTTDRIHCLVGGDLLDYDVSDRGERRLDYHMQRAAERDIPYKLVVVCSTERENHSRIVAALDKYRRPPIPLLSHEKTVEYIKEKLTFNLKKPRVKPSAEADNENCTVRVVKSWRAGVGKTLHKKRLAEKLHSLHSGVVRTNKAVVSIPLHEREINIDSIMSVLLHNTLHPGKIEPRLFHIDLSHEVQEGVDYLLFQLLILGCLTNSTGHVWRKLPYDLYIVETMPLLARDFQDQRGYIKCMHRCLDLLPDVTCRSPVESVKKYQGNAPDIGESDLLFDGAEFRSSMFQRPFQYLYRLDMNRGLGDVDMRRTEGNPLTCLQTLLKHCGIPDPSWAELRHFVWFLNTQLVDFESSAYLSQAAAEDLPGFAQFVLRFLIQMSRDFATRSLKMSEESPIQMLKRIDSKDEEEENDEADLRQFQLRRTWESSPHPYLFFNMDRITMTFLGFNIERQTGNLVDAQTGTVLEAGIMKRNLQDALKRNRVPINENFDSLPREEKLSKLCSVMGVDVPYDPDPTYELTTDNVKKILAIYMRFRCDIPVIIMGETGCGKTRLVKFMCQLQCPIGVKVQNMVLMKVHGGTRRSDIIRKVEEAERIAQENTANYGQKLYTVLFFDEANTTEAIGLIKEIMCDHAMEGEPLKLCQSLKIVAACNPYRKHSEDLIKRLEQAGLGYHVDADKTTDRMGRVPMRRLVYRVQPLPQSMLPLVWDFGQLDTKVEEMYIKQMVLRYIQVGKLPNEPNLDTAVSHILTSAQEFMRSQKDECSFVSLRDVERVLEVMSWFYRQTQGDTDLFDLMEEEEETESEEEVEDMEERIVEDQTHQPVNDVTKSLVLALGVCYQACLKNREEFREEIVREFRPPCVLPKGPDQMADIITRCQNIFLEIDNLGANIAKNQALRENVFMMVVCIELRIPLFLVGKPGSSKSLAKTIVADAMQGNAAHTEVYRNYKQVQMVSFQCSPLSVPEGIVGTFRQCAMYQKDKDLNRFVSVVVLDEVGLAEDSPRMPLKTLHPLLEDGCQGDETPEEHKKVAFIGISNWALDPAKMNRGILVQREVPDLEELIESADGICSGDKNIKKMISPLIEPLAVSYLDVFKIVVTRREFYGLRDFYSLIKMVYSFAKKNRKKPTWLMLQHCIKRNFGGFEHSGGQDPLAVFSQNLTRVSKISIPSTDDPDCSPAGLIEACLKGDGVDSDTRYLLLLTENYGALTVLQQKILTMKNAITIFGSSFPSDQEYTQVCRNINRIKVCMETGNTVVLLNLENLYESLYDALNQYYVYFGGERYVDLGLGTHRVKCRVHKNFRLIVVAEKEIVYSKFPIPLINRLEKHFLNISTMLSPVQVHLAQKLEKWAEQFIKTSTLTFRREKKADDSLGDVFMGYHADTCASIILLVSQQYTDDNLQGLETEVLKAAKEVLLWCATPDGVFRAENKLPSDEFTFVVNTYCQQQKHDNLLYYLDQKIKAEDSEGLYAQVTTHSKLITTVDVSELSQYLHIPRPQITLLTLQSFDTEQQFCRQVKQSFERELEEESLLIVQCDSGNENASLVACAQYCVLDQLQQVTDKKIGKTHIVFIIHLPRVAGGGFTGFQCGLWHSVHIDDLRPDSDKMPSFMEMKNKRLGTLLENATGRAGVGDTEDMDWECRDDSQPIQESGEVEMMEGQDVYPHDFDDMMEHTGQVHVERKVDIALFIKLTTRPALAMVKDAEDSERTTERVKILLELLHQETKGVKVTFMQGIGQHLAALMKEKEETMGHSAESWLYAEATKRDCINRAGTFRKARNQCIIEKLSPILAGIIAQLDTNSNLDLLIQRDPSSWEHKLWLEIINNPSATQIEYSMVVSPKKQEELPEVMVKGTGCDGLKFNALMPFSWLIYRLIDQILRTSQDVDTCETIDERVMRVSNIIEKATLGKILQKCLSEVKVMDYVKAYLSDFVHMVYHVTSQEEHGLICQNLLNGINMEFREGLPSVVMNFVAIHTVYSKCEPRLRNFASITRVWPDCSERIIEFQQKSSQFYLVTDQEMTLDVLGLYLLLQTLEPNKDSLSDQKGRQLWQKQVHKYRPVVERILEQFVTEGHEEGIKKFGRRCIEGIKETKCVWTKVVVMKLFLQHVCSDEVMPVERLMPLWVMLKDSVDFKNIESLEKVEKFLKMCMKSSVTKAFGRQEICKACESEVTERPILLPCKDLICVKCYNDLTILQTRVCPVCHNEIPEHFNPHQDNTADIKIRKLNNFKSRCNSFFMDLVSQLCFSDDEPPSNQVVQKLMSYITATARRGQGGRMASKEMSVFEEGIDPTPVLRSFLLQHLLRTSSMQVKQYLEMYLQQAEDLMSLKENEEKMVDLCLLIIQCLEDSFHHDIAKSTDPMKSKIRMATQMLQHDVGSVVREGLDVEKLYCMAETRFGLTVVAEVLHKLLVEKSIKHSQQTRKLLEAAGRLCDECGSRQPKLFLIKHLCRCFGIETYQKICKTTDVTIVRWLSVPELQKNEIIECSDRFIVSGDQYKELREKLTQAALGQNMDIFNAAVQAVDLPDYQKRTLVLLAVMREITMCYLYPGNKRRVTRAAVEQLQQFLSQHPLFSNQTDLPAALCRNVVWRRNPQLTVQEGMDLGHQSTVCLLNHFFITLLEIPEERTLVEPLNRLVQQPGDMQNSFLPTMPQDDVAEIKEALLAARRGGEENPVFYRCPNGHPYVIGNCGRPATVGRCKDCGLEIGGQSYQLRAGNIVDQGLDQTATGHVLGRAEGRQPDASPERGLSPIECAIVRLFTHMAMYLGASINQQAIKSLIKPDLRDNDVVPFLWAHIEKDLLTIQRTVGRSVDDVYILIHSICRDMMNKHRGGQLNQDICVLANKAARKKWEEDFAKTYLSPVLQEMTRDLKTMNKKLANDQRLGSDPLLCLLFEIDIPSEHSSPSSLHNVAAVWRYRSQITMDHLLHTVQVQAPTHKVLLMFLQEEKQLRAIRLVPSIMKLQKLLIQRFQRKLDRGEALTLTIEDMIKEYENEGRLDEMRSLVNDFILAWQCVRDKLLTYTFPTMEGLTKIPKEFCQKPITDAHPVSVLLPTFRDNGLCAYGLLYYLLKKQNNFLQEYCKVKKLKYIELPKVQLRDVTPAHLISYHPDRDILPMVMANCHYTFQVGKGTKIDYNFGDLERQLMDRFLFSKSVIEMRVYEFEMMTYRSETTNAVVFRDLRQKIKQEPLTPVVANQICEETRAYPDLCETLDKLEITISFLKSVKGDPSMSLEKFMTQTLKMENPFPSQKARSSCQCKHAQSLWITLAMEKTRRQASHKQDAFEGVVTELREELNPAQRDMITSLCEEISLERLDLLLEILFECIMLTITVPKGTDDDDLDMAKLLLRDTLLGYISAPQYNLDLNYPGWTNDLIERIPNEGAGFTPILNNQAVDTWLFLYALFTVKQNERRY